MRGHLSFILFYLFYTKKAKVFSFLSSKAHFKPETGMSNCDAPQGPLVNRSAAFLPSVAARILDVSQTARSAQPGFVSRHGGGKQAH
jgi:hypothetical protein